MSYSALLHIYEQVFLLWNSWPPQSYVPCCFKRCITKNARYFRNIAENEQPEVITAAMCTSTLPICNSSSYVTWWSWWNQSSHIPQQLTGMFWSSTQNLPWFSFSEPQENAPETLNWLQNLISGWHETSCDEDMKQICPGGCLGMWYSHDPSSSIFTTNQSFEATPLTTVYIEMSSCQTWSLLSIPAILTLWSLF